MEYDIGLQAGKKVAKKVDAFIKSLHKNDDDNFDPVKKKVSPDGDAVYHWCEPWGINCLKLTALLEKYDDADEDDCAYKMVVYSDDAAPDLYCNRPGFDCFDELRAGLMFPDFFHTTEDPVHDVALIEKPRGKVMSKHDVKKLMDALPDCQLCCVGGFPLTEKTDLMGFITLDAAKKLRGGRASEAGSPEQLSGLLEAMLVPFLKNKLLGPGCQTFRIGAALVPGIRLLDLLIIQGI